MANIQSKKKAVIQAGAGYVYNPATFIAEHKVPFFHVIDDPQELLRLVKPFEKDGRKFITFDTETYPHFADSRDVPVGIVRRWVGSGKKAIPQDFPFCISICDGKNSYTIFDTFENGFAKFKQLAPLFEDESIEKIAHNWKYDAHMFANIGMVIKGRVHDTVVLTKLVNENRPSFELKMLAAKKPGSIVKFEYMVDNYKQTHKISMYTQLPRDLLAEYANADVWNCYLVFVNEYDKLIRDDLVKLYDRECELMIALYAEERYGMLSDEVYEAPLKEDLQRRTDAAEAAIYEEAGRFFNINSTTQLYDVLISLGVERSWIKMTDKGNPSLDKDALNYLGEVKGVSIVNKILEYRKFERLLNTYAVGIYSQRDKAGYVHGNINQTEATTGRMSITKPALQTLPKKDKSIRRVFIPEEGNTLFFMDLDQIEYRLFAHYAKIPMLLEAITNGYDVHAATAALIFHIQLEELIDGIHKAEQYDVLAKTSTDPEERAKYDELAKQYSKYADMRSKGKTINFALIYGVGIDHLSDLLKCSVTEATNLKVLYFSQLPEAKIFINTVYQVVKERGFVKNFYGRRRRLDKNDSYKAPNALIQGAAADYIKDKKIDMFKYIRYNKLKTKMLLPVHDEIILAVDNDEFEHVPVLRWLMSDFKSFRCNITAGIEKGTPSWGQKTVPDEIGFTEPTDMSYLNYNVYDGSVFYINK